MKKVKIQFYKAGQLDEIVYVKPGNEFEAITGYIGKRGNKRLFSCAKLTDIETLGDGPDALAVMGNEREVKFVKDTFGVGLEEFLAED